MDGAHKGEFFYWNVRTNETTWEKPKNYVWKDNNDQAMSDPILRVIIKIQIFRGNAERMPSAKLWDSMMKKTTKVKEDVWVETTDPNTGANYYYNKITNEVTWDDPRKPKDPPKKKSYGTTRQTKQQKHGKDDRTGGGDADSAAEKAIQELEAAELRLAGLRHAATVKKWMRSLETKLIKLRVWSFEFGVKRKSKSKAASHRTAQGK